MANIGFIVDSSGSLRRDYNKEKEFVKGIATSFGLGNAGSRAGVVTFSYEAKLSIGIDQFNNVNDFNKAVDDIPLMGYTTRIDKALQLAKEKLFLGARKDATNILILLTDGSQTPDRDAVNPAVVAKELTDDSTKLIVIGIGKGIKVNELRSIAGNPSNVYLAKDFNRLRSSEFVQQISGVMCKSGWNLNHFILYSTAFWRGSEPESCNINFFIRVDSVLKKVLTVRHDMT